MKKVVFLSDMAFDANISIVKHLSFLYDVYFMSICREGVEDRIGKVSLDQDIECTEGLNQFMCLKRFLNLEKTFLIKHYSKRKMGWKSLIKKLLVDFKVFFFLKSLKPHAVMVDSLNFPITRFFYRKKIVYLMHDPFPHSGEKNFYRLLSDVTVKFLSARFVLFNESQKDSFIKTRHVHPNKVFTAFLSVYEFLEIFDKGLIDESLNHNIFFWGRISAYKGVDYLIEGFKQYLKETGDEKATLTIAGAGEFYFDVQKAIQGYPQICVINRFFTMQEMVHYVRNSLISVCPYTDATQSGVIMSAFALKKTILATEVGGLPEMLDNGSAGILIPPCSAQAICVALKEIFASPSKIKDCEFSIERLYFNDGKKSWQKGVKGIERAIESL